MNYPPTAPVLLGNYSVSNGGEGRNRTASRSPNSPSLPIEPQSFGRTGHRTIGKQPDFVSFVKSFREPSRLTCQSLTTHPKTLCWHFCWHPWARILRIQLARLWRNGPTKIPLQLT